MGRLPTDTPTGGGDIVIHPLMPGAMLVETPEGVFQIGAPFDAFKRMLLLTRQKNLPIPYTLISPEKLSPFEMALWAPEFYVLHHLFLLGAAFKTIINPSKVRLFTAPAHIELAKKALRESITGPTAREMRSWRRDGKRVMHNRHIDTLAKISDFMAIKRRDGSLAEVDDFVDMIPLQKDQFVTVFPNVSLRAEPGDHYTIRYQDQETVVSLPVDARVPPLFLPPVPSRPLPRAVLGVVPLGNRSGFSVIGPNTGFLLWVNGNPVVVDGPYGTVQMLNALGVHQSEVKAYIVTHVHEDHIGALVELVLLPHRPTIITAEPIYRCLLTKLAVYLNRPVKEIPRYLNYQPISPGHARRLFGADFRFFYTAHPIPTLGLTVQTPLDSGEMAGITISGDCQDLNGLNNMLKHGVISRSMHKRLVEMVPPQRQEHHRYFVDAGQAVIHGNDRDWHNNPNDIVYYHTDAIDRKAAPRHHEMAILGKQYILAKEKHLPPLLYERVASALHFSTLKDHSWINTLVNQGASRYFPPGTDIIRQGEPLSRGKDKFYVIVSGSARVLSDGEGERPLADLGPGEFFGEIALLTGGARTATVQALSPLEVFEIPGKLFADFVEANNLLPQFQRLWEHRPAIERASLFCKLDVGSRNIVSMSSKVHHNARGVQVFPAGAMPRAFFLVSRGAVRLDMADGQVLVIDARDAHPFFGYATALDGHAMAGASVTVESADASLVEVPSARIRSLCKEAPIFRYAVAVAVAGQEETGHGA